MSLPSNPSVAAPAEAAHAAHPSYLTDETTLRSWLLTLDHKRIGVMYLFWVLLFFLMGGALAMALRLELLTPGPSFMDATTYNQTFTLHGVIMIFMFMVPGIPGAFGNFMLPLMLGARDVAFPRLNLASLYVFLAGACFTLWGMINGGIDTGWTFYVPYSTQTTNTVVPIMLGLFIIGFSSILTGINFITTTHTMRAPGITWFKVPLFVWALYATSIIQVLATPVLGLALLLVLIENSTNMGIFDPALGGDPILFQHLFWFYSHPAVYIMVLPAFGVISEVVSAFSRKNLFGYRAVVFASLGIAFVGFFVWGHHMFVSGQSTFDAGLFAVLTMLVGVFTAIKVFNWVGTVYAGAVDFKTPFAYFCGFLFFTVFGGMTGIAVATVSLDVHWHDTYFVVAHFHFVMVGAVVMAFLAALHYWLPKMFGKGYPEGWGLVAAALVVIGFAGTFIPQFLLGNFGMPRRYFTYPERYQALHVASTAGASLLLFGFGIITVYLVYSLAYGRASGRNPFDSRGYEWLTESPPPTHNFVGPQPTYDAEPHLYVEPERTERPTSV